MTDTVLVTGGSGFVATHLAVDNHRSVDELGLAYRPVRETMLDHYGWWRARRARPRSPGK